MSLPTRADLIVPFFKTVSYPLGVLGFVALTWAVIVGTSNAVNLTDGLDGGDHAHRDGGQRAGHLRLRGRPRRLFEVPAVSVYPRRFRTDGAVRGDRGRGTRILWFNAYPAQVFMGDVGALALGGALGTIAVIVRQEIVLFIMGGVFVVETLSVMIQVTGSSTPSDVMEQVDAYSAWLRCIITSKWAAGRKPRWWCASGSSA